MFEMYPPRRGLRIAKFCDQSSTLISVALYDVPFGTGTTVLPPSFWNSSSLYTPRSQFFVSIRSTRVASALIEVTIGKPHSVRCFFLENVRSTSELPPFGEPADPISISEI